MAKQITPSNEKYQGPSAIISSIGGFFAGGFAGRFIGSSIIWLAGAVTGAVIGWKIGSKGEAQHQDIIAERNGLKHQIDVMEASQEAAKAALGGWADRSGKLAAATFTDKTASVDNGPRSVG